MSSLTNPCFAFSVLIAAAVFGSSACGSDSSGTSSPVDAGKDVSLGGSAGSAGSGGSGGGAGTASGGTPSGGSAGADAEVDAPEDAPPEAQACTDAGTTFPCSALLTGAQISYDPTTSEIAIQLPSSFPKMKHVSAHTDVAYGTGNTTCDGFDVDVVPPSTTIRVPFSATTYPNLDNLWVRDLQLTDECDGIHALDPAANGGCEEPHAKAGTPPSMACETNPDANCKWECS